MINENPVIDGLLHCADGMLNILNSTHQIIATNDSFLKWQGISDAKKILGLRPGETMKCPHADKCSEGCGTSKACTSCGVAIAIATSLKKNEPIEKICTMTAGFSGKPAEITLQVKSMPIAIEGKQFLMLFLQDISNQQRRTALERTFFHDLNNILFGLSGAAELLTKEATDTTGLIQEIYLASIRLREAIEMQRSLTLNEFGNYNPKMELTTTGGIQQQLRMYYSNHPVAKNKQLDLHISLVEREFKTDSSLLIRILSNMITNALEATSTEHSVRVWVEEIQHQLTFCVQNAQEIPSEVTHRIFERNFSTKQGSKRGTGTFSMKLFGEKVLGGIVNFETSAEKGTIFKLALPV